MCPSDLQQIWLGVLSAGEHFYLSLNCFISHALACSFIFGLPLWIHYKFWWMSSAYRTTFLPEDALHSATTLCIMWTQLNFLHMDERWDAFHSTGHTVRIRKVRVFMWSLWFLLQSASSLEIHFSCSSLTKAMFYSQHHKNSFLKLAKSAHFPPFSLTQILLIPCWLWHRGITSNLHGVIRFLSWEQIQLL